MNTIIFDMEIEAKSLWRSLAAEFNLTIECSNDPPIAACQPADCARIIVIDLATVGGSINSGIELCHRISKDTLVFTGADMTVASAVQLMSRGATWVFRKPLDPPQVRQAFERILQHAERLQRELEEHTRLQALFRNISTREHSVLEMVLNGVPNKQIAKELQVSVRTVEARRAKIYRKCEVQSVTELVRRVDHAKALTQRFGEIVDSRTLKTGRRRMHTPSVQTSTRAS